MGIEFHVKAVEFILSHEADIILGLMGLLLMVLYLLWAKFTTHPIPRKARRIRMITKAFNWGVFGMIFLLFDFVTDYYGLNTWRSTARIALFFLMLSELGFQIGTFGILWGDIKQCKLIRSFQSLLL